MRQKEFENLEKETLVELLILKQQRLFAARQRLKRARNRIVKQKEIISYQRSRIIDLVPQRKHFVEYELIPKINWYDSSAGNNPERAVPAL